MEVDVCDEAYGFDVGQGGATSGSLSAQDGYMKSHFWFWFGVGGQYCRVVAVAAPVFV